MKSCNCTILAHRNGLGHHDYSVFGWDDLPIDGIVTSIVRLDILSMYSLGAEKRLLELEIFIEHGGIAVSNAVDIQFYIKIGISSYQRIYMHVMCKIHTPL